MKTQMMIGRVVADTRASGEIVYGVSLFQMDGGVPEVLEFNGLKAANINLEWYLQGESERKDPVSVWVDFHVVSSGRRVKDMTFVGYDLRLRGVSPVESPRKPADDKKAA